MDCFYRVYLVLLDLYVKISGITGSIFKLGMPFTIFDCSMVECVSKWLDSVKDRRKIIQNTFFKLTNQNIEKFITKGNEV
ncbi:hypothetical protein [Chengkuizengella sediminis]|uniref:hypothetical protein n=1 Tax=Chengkuizengella sediminis TaxID=1885917 RepID=UPI0013897EC7|nr:hypothetical protein [Chengkuizengella sediminis]NDI35040.1 hypothetical protein [Chengkuizengella sediminis]